VKEKPESQWVVKYCQNSGCDARIRDRIDAFGDPVCKWCREIERGEREPIPSVKSLMEKVTP
jgi:hypothetical protein